MMRILKIRTWMTPQEAETVCHLFNDLQESIGQEYGEEIAEMHRQIQHQQEEKDHPQSDPTSFNDEIAF